MTGSDYAPIVGKNIGFILDMSVDAVTVKHYSNLST